MTNGFKTYLYNLFLVNTRWIFRPRRRNSAACAVVAVFVLVTLYISTIQTKFYNVNKTSRGLNQGRYWVHRMYGSADVGNSIAAKWNYSEYNGTYNSIGDWVNPGLDILHTAPFHFLPNYKNPCWYEPLREYDVYKDNKYIVVSRAARIMSLKMMKEWSRRIADSTQPKRLRCLPYFLVIGQPKSGSTDIFQRITSHPDVENPPIKELHWWSRNRQGRNVHFTDIIPLPHYTDMFDEAALRIEKSLETNADPDIPYHPKITGEASVSVFWENDDWYHYPENRNQEEALYTNPDYIHHVLPDIKLILILRNPTERLFSDYLYFKSSNKSAYIFHKFVENAIDVYTNCTARFSVRFCIYNKVASSLAKVRLRVGMYESFLKDWFRVFPREQILIIRLEDYSRDIHGIMGRVYDFLGLRKLSSDRLYSILNKPIVNKRRKKDKKVGGMFKATKGLLDKFYAPYNQRLAALLNNNDFLWGAPPIPHIQKTKNIHYRTVAPSETENQEEEEEYEAPVDKGDENVDDDDLDKNEINLRNQGIDLKGSRTNSLDKDIDSTVINDDLPHRPSSLNKNKENHDDIHDNDADINDNDEVELLSTKLRTVIDDGRKHTKRKRIYGDDDDDNDDDVDDDDS